MKRLFSLVIFALILLSLTSNFVSAQSNETTCAYFFYGDGCPHCAKIEPFIEELEKKYDYLEITKFEIYANRTNMVLLNDYFDFYGVTEYGRGVPAIFIGEKSYAGDEPIMNNFENEIISNVGVPCPNIIQQNETSKTGFETLTLATVIGAALVDSINPCAIAVLLILMGALLISGDKKKSLKAGLAFTISIYIAYFLFGIGLFSALQISGLSYWFYKIVGFIAIIIGLLNIKDYFWYAGGGFVMEIPRKWRPTLKKLLGSVTSPLGAFLMGFVVCLFELPCTGGPYLFILGLLAEKTTMVGAIPILLIYNLFFVLPLIIITLMLFYGFSNVEKANKWKDKNIRILHLIAGIVMLVLGILVVFGLV